MCLIHRLLDYFRSCCICAVPHDHVKSSMDHRMTHTAATMLSTARIMTAAPAIMLSKERRGCTRQQAAAYHASKPLTNVCAWETSQLERSWLKEDAPENI